MECTSFDSTYRSNIMEDLASYETNFHIPLLFNKINDMNMLSALRSVGIYGNADLFTDASVKLLSGIISANNLNSFAVPALSVIRYFPKSLSWMNWSKIIISTNWLNLIQTVLNFGYQFWVFVKEIKCWVVLSQLFGLYIYDSTSYWISHFCLQIEAGAPHCNFFSINLF